MKAFYKTLCDLFKMANGLDEGVILGFIEKS